MDGWPLSVDLSVTRRMFRQLVTTGRNALKLCHHLCLQTQLKRDRLLDLNKLVQFIIRHRVAFESHTLMQNPCD